MTLKGIKEKLGLMLRDQGGQILPLSLAMLAIGSLVVVPLLNLTGTALKSGIREESRMYEHYAANAGIMDGIREIITNNPNLPDTGENWTYSIPDTNSRATDITITTLDQYEWKVASLATGSNGSSTRLECYVERARYPRNAVMAASVTLNTNSVVNGNVQYDSTLGTLVNNGTINGEIIDQPIHWPTADEVAAFYLEEVDGAPTHEGDLILNLGPSTIGNPYSLGPIYINGNLIIYSLTQGAARLDGTVYVTGNVTIGVNARLYQNSNNLYADGAGGLTTQATSTIYDGGCLVSRQGITLAGSRTANNNSLVWSLEGSVSVNPQGTLYGIVLSGEQSTNGKVTLESSRRIDYEAPPSDLPLPPLPPGRFSIVGWEAATTLE